MLAEALSAKAAARSRSASRSAARKRTLSNMRSPMRARRWRASLPRRSSQRKLLAALGDVFGLSRIPLRIEVYDNSHIQGTNAVGAMIVAGPEGFQKTNIASSTSARPTSLPAMTSG